MPDKTIWNIYFIFLLKLILVFFLNYEHTYLLSLFSSLLLIFIALKYLFDRISAISIALLGFAVLSFFDIFKFNTIFLVLTHEQIQITDAHHYTVIWIYASFQIFLTAFLVTKKKVVNTQRVKITRANVRSLLFTFFPTALIALVAYRILFEILGSHNPYLLLLSFIPKAAAVVAFFLILKRKKLIYFFLFLIFLLGFNEVSRRVYITLSFVIIPLLMSFALSKYGKINFIFKALLGVLFGFAFFFMNYLRADTKGSAQDTLNSTLEYMLQFQAIDTFNNTAFVIDKLPKKYPYYYGETYFAVFFQFIPRSLWAKKPVSFGAPLGLLKKAGDRDFTPEKWMKKTQGFSYSPGFIGEAYANFGILGIILMSWLFGYATKKFDNEIKFEKVFQEFSYLPYLSFYSSFFLLLRGDFLMATYFSILFFLYLLIITRIFSVRYIIYRPSDTLRAVKL